LRLFLWGARQTPVIRRVFAHRNFAHPTCAARHRHAVAGPRGPTIGRDLGASNARSVILSRLSRLSRMARLRIGSSSGVDYLANRFSSPLADPDRRQLNKRGSGRVQERMPVACSNSCLTLCKCACHIAGEKQKCVQSQHVW